MNAKELAEIVDKLGWLPSPESGINPDLSRDAWATILRALRLLAAAEANDVAGKYSWECNECGSQEYTMSVSEDDVQNLGCGNCGGNEWHKARSK